MNDKKTTGPLRGMSRWMVALLLGVLVAGVFSVWWAGQRADRQMRGDLLQQARLVAHAVNINRVKALTGTEADLKNPDYQRLKEQLSLVRQANDKCRFLYLMGRKSDGRIFFYVDSEFVGSNDYSPPGQIYEEVPEGYRHVFDTGTAAVEGPVADRWGRWISALVPLTDPVTGELMSVIGMDIDARTWKWDIASRAALPATLLLALFVLAASVMITNRSRAELRESESLQRVLLENIDAGVVIIDAETYVIEEVNKKGVELFQGTEDRIVGQVCHCFLCPAEKDRCPVIELGQDVNNLDSILLKVDGSSLPILKSVRHILINGKDKLLETFIDITKRKWAEAALQENEAKYRGIFQNAVMGIFRTTPDGRYLSINPAGAKMYGYNSEEEMMQSVTDMAHQIYVHPEDRKRLQEQLKINGFVEAFESPHYTKDGRIIWVSINVRVIHDNAGNALHYETTSQDITDRKHVEEAIANERERLKTLSENAPFGMVLIDKEGDFTYINRKFSELFGYDLSNIPDGRTWFKKAYPDGEYRHAVISAWRTDLGSAEPGEQKPRIFTATCKDGTQKVIQFITSALISGDYLMTCEDITEMKQLESQLRQGQKMEAIGTLAGGIAHDFNNILTALMGYAALIQMKLDITNPLRPYVDEVLSASEKAVDLTQSLLAFSRQQSVNLVPLDINNTVKTAEKLLRRLLTEDIEFYTSLTDDEMIIMADKSQMDQILFNLITNARDAMQKGGTLTIETKTATIDHNFLRLHGFGEPGRYVRMSITDTGEGMDESIRAKIFDPFFTTKEVGKGTGLGLATVYGIVKQHNGYITVESAPGLGSAFHIYLPRVTIEVDEAEERSISSKGGKETVLIAEDNEGVRHFIGEALKGHGYTIREAIDGEDAVEKFKQHHDIDLIIIDSVMPKMNGREAYEEIHRINPGIKVLFTSGYTKDIVLDKGIEEKEFDFIAKPLSLNKLLRKVREILDR